MINNSSQRQTSSRPFQSLPLALDWAFYAELAGFANQWGWSKASRAAAAEARGYSPDHVAECLPNGRAMSLGFAQAADCEMLNTVGDDLSNLRVHERIAELILSRFRLLSPYKPAIQRSLPYLLSPAGPTLSWRTVDAIWVRAGDASSDINRYSKRGLLLLALAPTMADWLSHDLSEDRLRKRLEERLKGAMTLGQTFGKFVPKQPPMTPSTLLKFHKAFRFFE